MRKDLLKSLKWLRIYNADQFEQFWDYLPFKEGDRGYILYGNAFGRVIRCYPAEFEMLISQTVELNQSMTLLLKQKVEFSYLQKKLVPVMILRSLIDIAVKLKAYLLYPDKEEFLSFYKEDAPMNKKWDKDGNKLTTNYVLERLNEQCPNISELGDWCNKYVHPAFDAGKYPWANHALEKGFMSTIVEGFAKSQCKVTTPQYDEALGIFTESDEEYEYLEETVIADYAISVNELILDLFREIMNQHLYPNEPSNMIEPIPEGWQPRPRVEEPKPEKKRRPRINKIKNQRQ